MSRPARKAGEARPTARDRDLKLIAEAEEWRVLPYIPSDPDGWLARVFSPRTDDHVDKNAAALAAARELNRIARDRRAGKGGKQ